MLDVRKTDLGVRKTVLDNGMTVLTCPMPEKSTAFVIFGTKFGSIDRCFTIDGKMVSVPAGTAHFLEHKLFENEGTDAFKLFARTGASSNAYTSFDRTCFVFSAADNFYESLRILLDFVREPYFTDETVAKEQGIIGEEIRMYDDSPNWQLLSGALDLMYRDHPIRDDIAGTEQSIAEITPQMLYDCYNAFYTADNMVISIAGNFDEDRVLDICRAGLSDMKRGVPVGVDCGEPVDVVKQSGSKQMPVAMKQFTFAYKEEPFSEDQYINELYLEMILYILAGSTSRLYSDMYDEGLINASFGFEILQGDDFMTVLFSGDSRDPEEVSRRIMKAVGAMKEKGIPKVRIEEARRLLLGDTVTMMDDPEACASEMAAAHFKKGSVYDKINAVCSAEKNLLEKILRGRLDCDKTVLFIIEPIES